MKALEKIQTAIGPMFSLSKVAPWHRSRTSSLRYARHQYSIESNARTLCVDALGSDGDSPQYASAWPEGGACNFDVRFNTASDVTAEFIAKVVGEIVKGMGARDIDHANEIARAIDDNTNAVIASRRADYEAREAKKADELKKALEPLTNEEEISKRLCIVMDNLRKNDDTKLDFFSSSQKGMLFAEHYRTDFLKCVDHANTFKMAVDLAKIKDPKVLMADRFRFMQLVNEQARRLGGVSHFSLGGIPKAVEYLLTGIEKS